jgi:ribosome-associated protein
MTQDLDPWLDIYVDATLGKKAFGHMVLDVRSLTSVADVFILCSGRSNRQVSAIAEFVQTELKTRGKTPLSVEGQGEGQWVLLDYGHVVIHVFYDPIRRFYDLEGLWADARRIRTGTLAAYEQEIGDFPEEEGDEDFEEEDFETVIL